MVKREKTQVVQFKLRIRESLRAKLEKSARQSGISINSEMERRLEASYDPMIRRDEFMGFIRQLAKEDEARDKADTPAALKVAAPKQEEQK